MKQFAQQLKWQFLLLARNNIISISIGITLFYALLLFLLRHTPNMDKVVTMIILNDPATIGVFFIGLMIIIEKNQQVLSALFVAPLNIHSYLLSRITALSLLGYFCALGLTLAVAGISFEPVRFTAGVMSVCLISSILGIWMVSYTTDFMSFMFRSIPVLLIGLNGPFLNYFEVTDFVVFDFFPTKPAMNLIFSSMDTTTPPPGWLDYFFIAAWTAALYLLAYRAFIKKIVNA